MLSQNKKKVFRNWKRKLAIFIAVAAVGMILIPAVDSFSASVNPFADVLTNYWAKEAIYKLANAKIISGYDDGTFKPLSNISREEFITMIVKALALELSAKSSIFTDVGDDSWAKKAIMTAKENGLINGSGEGKFNPDSKIIRQDVAVIIYSVLKKSHQEEATEIKMNFTDASKISQYAKEALGKVIDYKIFKGYKDGSIKPLNNITRAEAATIIKNLVELINGEELENPTIIASNVSVLHMGKGDVKVTKTHKEFDYKIFMRNTYEIYNGDSVIMGRVFTDKQKSSVCVESFDTDSKIGNVIYFNTLSKEWETMKLKEALIQSSCLILQTEEGSEYLIYPSKIYKHLENSSLEYLGEMDGSIDIAETSAGYKVSFISPSIPSHCSAEYMYVHSVGDALFDWKRSNTLDYWRLYTLDGESKWCYDGYYFPAPSTYVPSGENIYHQCIAAYLCKSFAYGAAYQPVSEDLTIATLATMLELQNDSGYFPTQSLSTWLLEDYNIGASFYDTRFNTELMEIFHYISEWSNCKEFDASINRYLEFFLVFAKDNHIATETGGWLVQDYWTSQTHKNTHSSLNHQLAEIVLLYHYADYFKSEEMEDCADKMLLGIHDTVSEWKMSDGNLHYARYPDGTYGGVDYPYLTYNDLLELQNLIIERDGFPDSYIQILLDTKKAWMDANKITEYDK